MWRNDRIHACVFQQIEIFFEPVIMVASNCAILAADNIAGACGKSIPMGYTSITELMPFDLVGSGGCPKEELRGKI